MAAVALVAGVVFLMVELRGLYSCMSEVQIGLDIAHGHLAEVIDAFFDEWKLTGAERDVGIMMLKGLDNDAIARVRKTASGTARVQAKSICSKSATDIRAEFTSLFMEELTASEVTPQDRTDQCWFRRTQR